MQKCKKWLWGITAALLSVVFFNTAAQAVGAGTTSYLTITVAVNASLSVSIDGAQSSTYTTANWAPSTASFAAGDAWLGGAYSSVTVRNDGNLTEKWMLSTGTQTVPASGSIKWYSNASTSSMPADNYAMQAVFGSSSTLTTGCPGNSDSVWAHGMATVVTNVQKQYGDTAVVSTGAFVGATLNSNGNTQTPDTGSGTTTGLGNMYALNSDATSGNGKRVICWRLVMPTSITAGVNQSIQLYISAATAN